MSCYCAASRMPPCGWCENSFECEICNTVKSQSEETMLVLGDKIVCGSCVENLEELALENQANFGPYPCNCDTSDLMMQGCKCGGI